MVKITIIYRLVVAPDTLRNSIVIALVVGTVLNLIYQGGPLVALNFDAIDWSKFGLTYVVPYFVSTYARTAARLRFDPGVRAVYTADLQCEACGAKQHAVAEDEIVPECVECKTETKWLVT
ncbi:MAG: nitrate/nitrite transporter NrtS [Gammaproteobacteria bacterium]